MSGENPVSVAEGDVVSFTYTNLEGQTKDRLVKIESVSEADFGGFDFTKEGYRHFRKNSVRNYEVLLGANDVVIYLEEYPNLISHFLLYGPEYCCYRLEDELPGHTVKFHKKMLVFIVSPTEENRPQVDGEIDIFSGDDTLTLSSTDDGTLVVILNGKKSYGLTALKNSVDNLISFERGTPLG